MSTIARSLALRIAAAAGVTLVACGGSTNTGSTGTASTGTGGNSAGGSTSTGGATAAGGGGGVDAQGGGAGSGGGVDAQGGAAGAVSTGGAGGQGGMPSVCYTKATPTDACLSKTDPMLVMTLTNAANAMGGLPGGACSINVLTDGIDGGQKCCYQVQPLLCGGRPLLAGGVARVARAMRRSDWA